MLDFLNVLYVSQQPGNRTLPGARLEPWMANVKRLRQAKTNKTRTFRKSYIRNPSQILYKPSQISLSQVLKSLLLLHFYKYNIASLIIFGSTLIGAYSLVYIITVYYYCLPVDIYLLYCLVLKYMGIFASYIHYILYKFSL